MKTINRFVLCLIICLTLGTGCTSTNSVVQNTEYNKTEPIIDAENNIVETSTEDDEKEQIPSHLTEEEILCLQKSWDGKFVTLENNIYYNESAGYKIILPEEYVGWYSVFEHNNSDCEYVTVFFMGKSNTCKNLWETKGLPGIELYSFSNKSDMEPVDGNKYGDKEIGKAKNIKYYEHRLLHPTSDVVFNDAVKNSLQGEEYDLLLEDERIFKKLDSASYGAGFHFIGFGNKKLDSNDKGTYLSDVKGKYSPPELPSSNIYVNEQCGYQLTLPESWLGWYYIDEVYPECICVYFFGKSITGTFLIRHFEERAGEEHKTYGLRMFYIMTEEIMNNGTFDSIRYIGTAHDTNYYFATATDATLPALTLSWEYWDDITEEEIELAQKDWEMVEQMNYEDVTKTFKQIDKGTVPKF